MRAALATSFRVEREIGRGGMATVYLADDLKHGRQVAIKVLKPELGSSIGADRFLREIAIASKLHHPHIVPLHDSGTARDLLYYVMPYVEGETLRERLTREKQLPIEDALRIARDVADALAAAHAEGVIHRDIKPENILLEGGHAVVADFGLARAIAQAAGESLTSSGIVAGTPAYMSPEQSAGDTELDARTDVYSLACVLYEMLTGEAPFTGTSAQAVVAKHMSQPVPSARVVRATVPPAVDAAIQRGLAKVPADRFATAREFADALAQPRERRRRHRLRTLVVLALLLGAGAALALLGPLKPGKGEAGSAAAASGESLVHVGVLPVAVRSGGGGADSGRVQLIQYLFVSELTRYRGLAVVDPFSLNGRLRAGATAAPDPLGEFRRLGLQYAVRITATPGPRGLELAYVLTDAKGGNTVEAGAFTDRDEADLPSQIRQAGGRIVAALDAATGGIAKELDVAPFLEHAPGADAVSAFLQGVEYANRGLAGGGEFFERALKLDHDFIAPRVYLVSGLSAKGDTAGAQAHLQVLESLKPRATPFEQALIGWCEAVVKQDWDGKIRHLRVALGYSPGNNLLLFNLAQSLWATGRLQEAVAPTREALASGWRFAPLYTLWGILAVETGELSGLRDTLKSAQSFSPPDPYVEGLLEALALFEADPNAAGQYAASFRAELGDAQVSEGYGEMAGIYRSLAQRARERGRLPIAVSLLQRAVDAGPRQPMLSLELARVLAESGNRRAAEARYRTVTNAEVIGAEALYLAGGVAERLGRAADARRYYTRYLEVAPGGPDAVRVRERLRGLGRPSGPP